MKTRVKRITPEGASFLSFSDRKEAIAVIRYNNEICKRAGLKIRFKIER